MEHGIPQGLIYYFLILISFTYLSLFKYQLWFLLLLLLYFLHLLNINWQSRSLSTCYWIWRKCSLFPYCITSEEAEAKTPHYKATTRNRLATIAEKYKGLQTAGTSVAVCNCSGHKLNIFIGIHCHVLQIPYTSCELDNCCKFIQSKACQIVVVTVMTGPKHILSNDLYCGVVAMHKASGSRVAVAAAGVRAS